MENSTKLWERELFNINIENEPHTTNDDFKYEKCIYHEIGCQFFGEKSAMNKHMEEFKKFHFDLSFPSTFTCQICSRIFDNSSDLNRHINEVHKAAFTNYIFSNLIKMG